jgi:hypothetical protein
MLRQQVFNVTVVDKLVISSRIAPVVINGEVEVLLVAAVVAKVVVKVFLEAAEVKEKAAGDTRMPVEAEVKKEEKEKLIIITLAHVLVIIYVIRQVILLQIVSTRKNLRG